MYIDKKFATDLMINVKCKHMEEFYNHIEELLPALIGITERYHSKKPMPHFEKFNFSFADIKNLSLAFFKDFSQELYQRLTKVLKNAKIEYSEPSELNEQAENYTDNDGKRVKITLNPTNDIKGVCVITHEFSHGVSERNTNLMKNREHLLGEIESLFCEKVYLDWLCENGVISQETVDDKRELHLQDLVENCRMLIDEYRVLKQLAGNYSQENINQVLENEGSPIWLEDTLTRLAYGSGNNKNLWGGFIARYVVGEVVAQLLYDEYQDFPLATSMKFAEYMAQNAEMTLEEGVKFLLGENYKDKINSRYFPKSQQNS